MAGGTLAFCLVGDFILGIAVGIALAYGWMGPTQPRDW